MERKINHLTSPMIEKYNELQTVGSVKNFNESYFSELQITNTELKVRSLNDCRG